MKINLEIIKASSLFSQQTVEDLNTKELVPKMVLRRRFTRAAKLLVELLHNIEFTQGRIMYASAYGEVPATANILKAILNKEGISPTDFQNSVYNTAVSYTSILHQNQHEIMTISSGDRSYDKLLKLGAIKAMDKDEIALLATETLNIDNISDINHCINYLESAIALKVKITHEAPTLQLNETVDSIYPKSIAPLIHLVEECKENQKNIIEVSL